MLTSWTYTYDDAGNILSKNTYAYTTGTLGAVLDTVDYTYDDDWGDLLTGYDGTEKTGDGSLSWIHPLSTNPRREWCEALFPLFM